MVSSSDEADNWTVLTAAEGSTETMNALER